MELLEFLFLRKENTAKIAKERLQIIIAKRQREVTEPDYLPYLRKDILDVVHKYVRINPEIVTMQLEQKDENILILELKCYFDKKEKLRS